MATKAKSSKGVLTPYLRASTSAASTLTFAPASARKVRELTKRASHQVKQLHLLMPLYQRTERILVPAGLKRMRDTSGIPPAQKDAGALLHALNHELQISINKLTDMVAVLQAHVEEAEEAN
jgi:hypothetical protein